MTRTCHVCLDEYRPSDPEYDEGYLACFGGRWIYPWCCGPAVVLGHTHCDLCLQPVTECGALDAGACARCTEREAAERPGLRARSGEVIDA